MFLKSWRDYPGKLRLNPIKYSGSVIETTQASAH
jgi:hypothetical protein